jgi:hypothetical protein
MAGLEALAARMNALQASIPLDASNAAVAAARAIIADLTQTSPAVTAADTGTAISNWITTVGNPSEDRIDAYSPSPKGRFSGNAWTHKVDPDITRENNAPFVQEQAEAALVDKQPGQPIYITNNLPYIGQLNDGSSTQAPGGFVERATIVASAAIGAYYDGR